MAGEKIGGGHFSATFTLHESESQGAVAASDGNPRGRGGEDFARDSFGVIERIGFPDFQQRGFVTAREERVGAGPRDKRADSIPELSSRGSPVQAPIFAGDLAGVGRAVIGLRLGLDAASQQAGNCVFQQAGAYLREAIVQGAGIVRLENGGNVGAEDIAGIEAFVDPHDGDTGLCVSVEDGPLNGGGAAVFGQERGVDIEKPYRSELQE